MRVVVSVAPDRFEEAAGAAEQAGLRVVRRLPIVGVLLGDVEPGAVPTLRAAAGVEHVEPDRAVEIWSTREDPGRP